MLTGVLHSLCERHLIRKFSVLNAELKYIATRGLLKRTSCGNNEQQVTEIYIEAILTQTTLQTTSYPEKGV
jgi:hypothetical protein